MPCLSSLDSPSATLHIHKGQIRPKIEYSCHVWLQAKNPDHLSFTLKNISGIESEFASVIPCFLHKFYKTLLKYTQPQTSLSSLDSPKASPSPCG